MTPVGYRIWIKPEYSNEKEFEGVGKFIIVESDRTGVAATTIGKVLAVGPTAFLFDKEAARDGKRSPLNEPWCKVGDKVLYSKYGGKVIVDPKTEEKTLVISDQDVIMVLDPDQVVVEGDDE
jgi:co-chaperonin GroES (HSP10)